MRPSEFTAALRLLDSMTLQQLQRLSMEAERKVRRKQAAAEIEKFRGASPSCPYCEADDISRWGMGKSGLQRWRCSQCKRTFSSAQGTGLAYTKRRDTFFAFIKNMLMPSPLSLREAADEFGIDRSTAWRWRMKACSAIEAVGADHLVGVVEADETFQRESRKGSREWVRHEKDPQTYPRPPRLRWYEYRRKDLPMKRGLSRWQVPIMTAMDRSGGSRADVLQGLNYKHIGPILSELLPPDAVLVSDKAQAYKKFSKAHGVRHVRVAARRGERVLDQTFHIQNVNSLHSRFKEFVEEFRGPAKKYLRRYVAWFMFRDIHRRNPEAAALMLREVLAAS